MKPIWMWLFPLCVVFVGLRVAWLCYPWWGHDKYDSDGFSKWIPVALWIIAVGLLSLLALGLGVGISSFIGNHSDQVWHNNWRGAMVSMRNSDGVSGSIVGGMFLVSGHIGSEQYYYYYTKNSDGSLQPHKWRTDSDTSVYEEDRSDGEVIQYDEKFKHSWLEWFAIPGDRLRMEFHIPKGTLKRSFSLD